MDYAREKFTFNISSLSSYVLGHAQHGSIDVSTADETVDVHQGFSSTTSIATLEIDVLQVVFTEAKSVLQILIQIELIFL